MIYTKNDCNDYAQLLKVYIDTVKFNRVPFIRKFINDDLLRLHLELDMCRGVDTVIRKEVKQWVSYASDEKDVYVKFKNDSDNDKLNSLKSMMIRLNKHVCPLYFLLLENYISGVKTNYTPFIETFTDEDIDNLLKRLKSGGCDEKSYEISEKWLLKALEKRKDYDRFKKYTDSQKLTYLKSNMNFKKSESCRIYVLYFEDYINNVKTNYTPFIETFTDEDIDNLLKRLKSGGCDEKSYKISEKWLTEAKKQRTNTNGGRQQSGKKANSDAGGSSQQQSGKKANSDAGGSSQQQSGKAGSTTVGASSNLEKIVVQQARIHLLLVTKQILVLPIHPSPQRVVLQMHPDQLLVTEQPE